MLKGRVAVNDGSRILQILLVSMFALSLDQISKWGTLAYLRDTSQVVEVTSFFNLRLGFNTGVSFGLFRDLFEGAPLLLALISLMIVVALMVWAWRTDQSIERISLAFITGGALGNILDRWRQGAVTDFLDFHWAGWHWPAFNGADIFICVGAICLLLSGIVSPQESTPGGRKRSLSQVVSGRTGENTAVQYPRVQKRLLGWLGVILIGYLSLKYWSDLQLRERPSFIQEEKEQAPPKLAKRKGLQLGETSPDANDLVEAVVVAKNGDTLDGLLKRAKLNAKTRAAAIRALSTEFNPRELRPGHEVSVRRDLFRNEPKELVLTVDAGVKFALPFDDLASVKRIEPALVTQERAVTFELSSSVYASLKQAEAPTRFAKDLSLMLDPLIPFNRAFKGGEPFNILWHDYLLADGREALPPAIKYLRIQMPSRVIELARSGDSDNHMRIYEDGELVRTLVIPVENGQISSVFGPRKHPVFGNVRPHTGVDYAAQRGAPVSASAAGEILYLGRRRGYGRVIEIEHEPGVVARYAHLQGFQPNLTVGSVVSAGEVIGSVGTSGIATGPNLHYEILRDGRPMDPLFGSRAVLASLAPPIGPEHNDLQIMRDAFNQTLLD